MSIHYLKILSSIILSCLLLTHVATAHAWTFELSEQELEQKLNQRLPIEKKKLIFTLKVSKLDVELKQGSERIGLVTHMEIRSPHLSTGQGKAWLDGKLEYVPEEAQFYFRDPQVREVRFENIPDKYHGLLKKLFQRAIQRRLDNSPVYKLDENKTRQQLAKALLKSVRVIDKKLVLEMSLF